MGCFTAPMALGIVTTVFRKKIPARYHMNWLNTMLWGGTLGLVMEHIAHQEVVPYFPFLTAMKSPADAAALFHEIMTIGVGMAAACILAWAVMVVVASIVESKTKTEVRQLAK
jgi:hypothetical protein